MLGPYQTYDEARQFRWRIPERYNMGVDVCDRQDQAAPALIYLREDGGEKRFSFADIKAASNRLANALQGLGIERGDRVGIGLAQSPEAAIAHVSAYRMGAVALPLFRMFGPDALAYRLKDSGAKVLITDATLAERVESVRDELPELAHIIVIDAAEHAGWQLAWSALLADASDDFTPVDTAADDPALLIYTSGTTGNPKGALHAHRVLLGHLPGVEFPHMGLPKPGDMFWTPADWAWVGGLLDVLLPAWHHGIPVLAHRMLKFDAEKALKLMADYRVRNTFLPPTAIKLMRQVPDIQRFGLQLRSVGTGGEPMGEELLHWGERELGVTISEFYGQTECNLVLGNNPEVMPVKAGSMGRPIPGHEVAIIDDQGRPLPAGEQGQVAVKAPDPVMMLRYWNNPEATAAKYLGDWLLTGDMAVMDDDGYFWHKGRADDVITSAGYRIGPTEIEDCLLKHPAVAMAAVVGVPDPLRTERVKAFIVLARDVTPSDALAKKIQDFVKQRLAAHEYPREIAFREDLPMTTTGKVMRRKLREEEQ